MKGSCIELGQTVALFRGAAGRGDLGNDGHADQIGEAARAHLGHQIGAIDLDRARADAEIVGDGLVGLAGDQASSTCRSRSDKVRELGRDGRGSSSRLPVLVPRSSAARTACEQRLVVERLLDEVDGAGLHRLDGQRHVAMAGDDDDRKVACPGLERRSSSMPLISGMRTSVTTQPGSGRGETGEEGASPSRRRARQGRPNSSRKASESRTASSSSTTCTIRSRHRPSPRCGRRCAGETEDGAAAGIGLGPDLAAMRLDDARRSTGRRPCPAGLVVTNGWNSCVGDLSAQCPGPVSATLTSTMSSSARGGRAPAARAARQLLHRLDGVAHEIEQHLLDLDLVDQDRVDVGGRSGTRIFTPCSLAPTSASALASSTSLLRFSTASRSRRARRSRASGG